MSYLPTGGPPIIIARNGYGGRVATGLGAAADRNDGVDKQGNRITPAKPAPSTWDKIFGFVKDAAGNAVKFYGQQQQQAGQQAAYAQMQQPSTPAWLVPAAIGVAGLGAVLILRGGKRKNPSRRRRR